jgi:hypothetical protein
MSNPFFLKAKNNQQIGLAKGLNKKVNMKYRKTFREALNDVDKKDNPEVKSHPHVDEVQGLKNKIQMLELELQQIKGSPSMAMPNPITGEIPLRTGVASALMSRDGPKPKLEKGKKKEIKLSGKSKIEINPDVEIGQISGGILTGTGNLH